MKKVKEISSFSTFFFQEIPAFCSIDLYLCLSKTRTNNMAEVFFDDEKSSAKFKASKIKAILKELELEVEVIKFNRIVVKTKTPKLVVEKVNSLLKKSGIF